MPIANTATVAGTATVANTATILDTAQILLRASVLGTAAVYNTAIVTNTAIVKGNALVHDSAQVRDNVLVGGNADVFGNTVLTENATIAGQASIATNVDWLYMKYNNDDITLYRSTNPNGYEIDINKNNHVSTLEDIAIIEPNLSVYFRSVIAAFSPRPALASEVAAINQQLIDLKVQQDAATAAYKAKVQQLDAAARAAKLARP